MHRSLAHAAVLVLGLTFLDDLMPGDLGLDSLSGLVDGTVATSEAPTKAGACEQATAAAVEKTSLEHRGAISSKNCSCSQRASTVETWTCIASVRWTKSQ